jgi:hypothetical protein
VLSLGARPAPRTPRPTHIYKGEEQPDPVDEIPVPGGDIRPPGIAARLQDGTVIEQEVQDLPGFASHRFTWEDSVGKFDGLVAGRIDGGLSREIEDAVRSLEGIQVADLMQLLAGM